MFGDSFAGIAYIPIWMRCAIAGGIDDYVVGVASVGGAGSHVGNPANGFPSASTGSIVIRMAVELALPDAITVPSGETTVKELGPANALPLASTSAVLRTAI